MIRGNRKGERMANLCKSPHTRSGVASAMAEIVSEKSISLPGAMKTILQSMRLGDSFLAPEFDINLYFLMRQPDERKRFI
ncbi:hypothetical protein [Bacteroides sp. 272]|uniref:hypothetical protein n=2 Tax=unclassified Bacteroides TaxID=2646097 RepID=UPI004063F3C2